MTTVYLDSSALGILTPGASGPGFHVEPDLHRMIDHLLDAGHDVVIVGDGRLVDAAVSILPPAQAGRIGRQDKGLTGLDDPEGWLITGSPESCDEVREHRRLRTILVGPATGTGSQVDRPADILARSLTDAVIEILTEDAMAPGGNGRTQPARLHDREP